MLRLHRRVWTSEYSRASVSKGILRLLWTVKGSNSMANIEAPILQRHKISVREMQSLFFCRNSIFDLRWTSTCICSARMYFCVRPKSHTHTKDIHKTTHPCSSHPVRLSWAIHLHVMLPTKTYCCYIVYSRFTRARASYARCSHCKWILFYVE